MARFASGKNSRAISDISGFEVKYTQLKTTWDNLRVEEEEYSPKHPQLTPARNVVDATALFNPRPNNDPENVTINIGFTQDIFQSRVARSQQSVGLASFGRVGHVGISLEEPVTGQAGTGAIGQAFAGFDVTGVEATGNVGTVLPQDEISVSPTGLAGTGTIGTVQTGAVINGVGATGNLGTSALNFDYVFDQTGVAGTGATGDENFDTQTGTLTGVAGSGAIGTVDNNADIATTGVSGTSAIGSFGESGDGTLNLSIQGIGVLGDIGTGVEIAESNVIEANETGFGEQYWGYGGFGGDNEIAGSGSIGTVTMDIFQGPNPQAGVEANAEIGTFIVQGNLNVTGVEATSAIGSVTLNTDVTITAGISGTGAIGSETAQVDPGFGEGAWNEGTWGE